MFSDIAKESQ